MGIDNSGIERKRFQITKTKPSERPKSTGEIASQNVETGDTKKSRPHSRGGRGTKRDVSKHPDISGTPRVPATSSNSIYTLKK